jgi:xylulokinase
MRRWSQTMISRLKLDASILPQVVESSELTGAVTEEAAVTTGLEPGTPVVGGAGDQAASAVGNGIVQQGVVSCTLGTSGVVFAHIAKALYDPAGRVHLLPRGHQRLACHGSNAGRRSQPSVVPQPVCAWHELRHPYRRSGKSPPEPRAVLAPYLMGERTPHLDATARGGWISITAKHSRADVIRSVIEASHTARKTARGH